jgi:CheY-like chemotaxis protein
LILVVDDEPSVVRAITATLATVGYRVIVAENGAAGLEAFQSHADEIDLVLADVVMPIMDGATMAQAIRRVRSEARVLLITASEEQLRI